MDYGGLKTSPCLQSSFLGVDFDDTISVGDTISNLCKAGLKAQSAASLARALSLIAEQNWLQPPRILITGSLYLAGEVLALDGTLEVPSGPGLGVTVDRRAVDKATRWSAAVTR